MGRRQGMGGGNEVEEQVRKRNGKKGCERNWGRKEKREEQDCILSSLSSSIPELNYFLTVSKSKCKDLKQIFATLTRKNMAYRDTE